jgi:hypothetical protein
MDPLSAVSIRAHFDRFPASVKGAFVLRGIDGDPHQVSIAEARLTPAVGSGRTIGLEPAIVDVAPGLDVFVPFEFAIGELEPGWYQFECDAAVDGTAATFPGGKRFCVAWPRAAARRGSVDLGAVLGASPSKVMIERVEFAGDHTTIKIAVDPPAAPTLRLSVDGTRHPVVDSEFDEASGRGTVTAYPVLRTQGSMRIEATGGDGVEVPLP